LITNLILENELIKLLGKLALSEDWDTILHSKSTKVLEGYFIDENDFLF
jgi:hypothetical protein